MFPRGDLVCFEAKMSEARRSQRLATDFSIARILASEEPSSSSSGSSRDFFEERRSPELGKICACCPSVNSVQTASFVAEERTSGEIGDRVETTATINANDFVQDLPWLHCTRYRPPRLPKRSSAGKVSKRRPGKHPRIPFTAIQLQILEERYGKGAYLARRDVVQLSLVLRLPQSRVKIWFQNRRARERRESIQTAAQDTVKLNETVIKNG